MVKIFLTDQQSRLICARGDVMSSTTETIETTETVEVRFPFKSMRLASGLGVKCSRKKMGLTDTTQCGEDATKTIVFAGRTEHVCDSLWCKRAVRKVMAQEWVNTELGITPHTAQM
jgi:hypothetical protein